MLTVSSNTKNLPKFLKFALLIVAVSFLGYIVCWASIIPFSTYRVFTFMDSATFQNSAMNTPLSVQLLLFQELSGGIAFLVNLILAVLAFQSTLRYIKNDQKWQTNLGKALIAEAIFFLLFLPTTVHHMGGSFLSMAGADFFVGLSYLLQVLLIVPPFITLGLKLKNNQNKESI